MGCRDCGPTGRDGRLWVLYNTVWDDEVIVPALIVNQWLMMSSCSFITTVSYFTCAVGCDLIWYNRKQISEIWSPNMTYCWIWLKRRWTVGSGTEHCISSISKNDIGGTATNGDDRPGHYSESSPSGKWSVNSSAIRSKNIRLRHSGSLLQGPQFWSPKLSPSPIASYW